MTAPTEQQAAEFAGYVRAWQAKLGLIDWRINVTSKRAKSCMAQMFKWDLGQRQVVCQLGDAWREAPPDSNALEQTAVHELLHVLLHELIETAKTPGVTDEAIASIEHRVINVLEPLLVPTK